ncbi:MAG: hypothetical protein HGA95_04685 [Caldiserica bacterium]|nr:hypothetical protein [Caldisericota bacterium]
MKHISTIAVIIAAMLTFAPVQAITSESSTVAENLTSINTIVSPNGHNVVYLTSRNTDEMTIPMISVYNAQDGSTKSLDYSKPINFGLDMTYAASKKFFAFVGFDFEDSAPSSLNFVPFDSMAVNKVPNVKGNILKICATGSFIVWFENGLSDKCSIMAKDTDNTAEPFLVASLDTSSIATMSLFAFEDSNKNYVLFDERTDNKSAICLFGLQDKTLTKLADSEFVESNPRYQAGKVFYTKSTSVDPNYFEASNASGTVECVTLDGQNPKTVYTFDKSTVPSLISNINNPTNFIFAVTNKNDGVTTVKKYDIAADSVFDAFKSEPGHIVSMMPESCFGNNIVYMQLSMRNESKLYAYDFINSKKTAISESNDIKVFAGIVGGKVAYVSIELAGSSPRDRAVKAIKLILSAI